MIYIQRRSSTLETVDEFETRKEALAMLKEYRRIGRLPITYYLLPVNSSMQGLEH